MTDRELLELAAKAAGIEYDSAASFSTDPSHKFFGLWLKIDGEPYEGQRRRWNPLTDDGDALRLAVALEIHVFRFYRLTTARWPNATWAIDVRDSDYGDSPYAATRRAIVRAAAEIGKAK